MNNYVSYGFIILLLLPFILFVPELTIYGVQSVKANNVIEDVTKYAEMSGGITPEVETMYTNRLIEIGLDPNNFSISYSKKGRLQHQEKFTVQLKGSFTFKTFNVLGTGIGNFKAPISAIDSGISEVWIR